MKPLEKAIAIAVVAHAGVVDKAGAPYVLHPLRMMLRMMSRTPSKGRANPSKKMLLNMITNWLKSMSFGVGLP